MKLVLAVACDEARVRPDGKVDVLGIFNELTAAGFPAVQDRMTVVFVIEWAHDTDGRVPLRADLVDEAGRRVLTIQGHTDVAPRPADAPPPQTRLVMPLEKVVFPGPGRYDFELEAGSEKRRAVSLFVRQAEDVPPGVPDPAEGDRV